MKIKEKLIISYSSMLILPVILLCIIFNLIVSNKIEQLENISLENGVNVIVIIVVFGGVLAFLFASGISKPIISISNICRKIVLGDFSEKANMGKKVSCSSIKNCDQKECPSYNRESYCWSESGSFAVEKHCPRALKGEDCVTCELYKKSVTDEIQEMGTSLNSLADNFRLRAENAMAIACGDLTMDTIVLSENDELGKAIEEMSDNLRSLVSNVKEAVQHIAAGSTQISDSTQALSRGAAESASSLQQITSSMTQIGSQVTENSGDTSKADNETKRVQKLADTGSQQMQQMQKKWLLLLKNYPHRLMI